MIIKLMFHICSMHTTKGNTGKDRLHLNPTVTTCMIFLNFASLIFLIQIIKSLEHFDFDLRVCNTENEGITNNLTHHEDDPLLDPGICQQLEGMSLVTENEKIFPSGDEEEQEEKEQHDVFRMADGSSNKVSKVTSKQRARRLRQDLKNLIQKQDRPQKSSKVLQGMSLDTKFDNFPSYWRRSRIRRNNKRSILFEDTNLKSITKKRVDQSQKVPTKLKPLTDFKVTRAVWEGKNDRQHSEPNYTLEELKDMGMEIIQWNGVYV